MRGEWYKGTTITSNDSVSAIMFSHQDNEDHKENCCQSSLFTRGSMYRDDKIFFVVFVVLVGKIQIELLSFSFVEKAYICTPD